ALVALTADQHPLPEGARERFLARIGADGDNAVTPIVPIGHPRRTRIWPGWLAAAAMLLLSIGLGIRIQTLTRALHATSQQLAEVTVESRHAHEVLSLLTAPQAQHVLLTANKMPPAPTARAVYLSSRGALVMEASNLKPLPADMT